MKDAQQLLDTIQLEQIEENIYRGKSHSIGSRRVFGGQVLAQALQAATLTVPDERLAHSMHGYFILPGDVNKPIIYDVDRIRDGRSFTTRRVVAIQNGSAIFNMSASFQIEEDGYEHQINMPNVPPPEALQNGIELMRANRNKLPEYLQKSIELPRPIEFRPVEMPHFVNPSKGRPFRHIWIRVKGDVEDRPSIHRMLLAYASDYNLLETALRPHGTTWSEIVAASIDHAMWFHRDFRMDEWLLYALDSPSASNARGFTRGNVFDRSGKLVASVVQEGLIRKRRKK
ncbi:MAG: acyl-CoA thioesterase II [Bacteroidota bacterium]